MTKEIVIAAYDKKLDWMTRFDSNIKQTIYRKGDVFPLGENEILITPNSGRCVHSFFNHIYKKYDELSDYTFFAQDYPFDHWEDIVEIVNGNEELFSERAKLKMGGYYGYHWNSIQVPSERGGIMWSMYPTKQFGSGNVLACYSNGHPQDHNPNINVDSFWDLFFDEPKPPMYEFIPGGHFGITKEHAQLRSKEFYGEVVKFLENNTVAPWIIERLECYIFNPKYKSKM